MRDQHSNGLRPPHGWTGTLRPRHGNKATREAMWRQPWVKRNPKCPSTSGAKLALCASGNVSSLVKTVLWPTEQGKTWPQLTTCFQIAKQAQPIVLDCGVRRARGNVAPSDGGQRPKQLRLALRLSGVGNQRSALRTRGLCRLDLGPSKQG